MDIATIIGIVGAGVFMLLAIGTANIGSFLHIPSVQITIGGAFMSTFVAYPLKKIIAGLKSVKLAFVSQTMDETAIIKKIIELSNVARKEGLLALEEATEEIKDEFLKKGILLIVDGTDPELVRSILETELAFIQRRHSDVYGYWEKVAELGPAWGMIGTLIGLINMLKDMNDPSAIGPNMSVALITTLYGSLLANLFAAPFANKMKLRSNDEVLLKEVMIEGLLSIQAGENPRVIEEKLKAFLAPSLRRKLSADEAYTEEEK